MSAPAVEHLHDCLIVGAAVTPSSWSLFHDGTVETARGCVPGDVVVRIALQYLRDRFPGDDAGFLLRLSGCTQFKFQLRDAQMLSNLSAIAALEPELLRAEPGDPLKVHCATDTRLLRCRHEVLCLDSGRVLTQTEQAAAADAYGREWSGPDAC